MNYLIYIYIYIFYIEEVDMNKKSQNIISFFFFENLKNMN